MVNVPEIFQPVINTVYPPNNHIEYERWFYNQYKGEAESREYLPVFWTGYYVNNNYGNDKSAIAKLQVFLNGLDTRKKYFTIIQYDDSILNEISHLDLFQFNMSKPYNYPLPLIGQPHPYIFNEPKKYLANFVGNITHPIREHAKTLQGNSDYYISFDRHSPEDYCRIISKSVYTLCYRGYGLNSFRIAEALQYNSIPVYISDAFIEAHNVPFESYGIKITKENIGETEKILNEIAPCHIHESVYKEFYTYEGCYKKIIEHLNKN